MTKEDYVSFEVAKLLKEKGFNGEWHKYYWGYFHGKEFLTSEGSLNLKYDYPAPTLQMAMKWLREVGYLIIVTIIRDGNDSQCLSYNIYKMNKEDKELEIIFNNYFPEFSIDSYKETIEAAIKYCLENLI